MSKTILMVHGMWGNSWVWDFFVDYFSNLGYKCLTPSLPYHNFIFTQKPDSKLGDISIYDYIEYLKNEINKLDQTPIIFGHSMGGLLTQILSSQGFATTAVLFNSVPPADISSFSYDVLRCMKLVFVKSIFRKPVLIKFKSMRYSAFNNITEYLHREYYNKLVYDSGRAFLEMALPVLSKNKITTIDEKLIKTPLLVIGSKKDRTISNKIAKKIALKYPTAEYKEFPENAHWIILEPNWIEVASFVNDWLNKTFNNFQ